MNELLEFLQKFLDNFTDCEYCDGTGKYLDDDCRICHGTGKRILSIGVLYIELPDAARALLEKQKDG